MKTNHSKLSSLLFNTDDTKKCLWHFSSPSFMRDYKDICSAGYAVVLFCEYAFQNAKIPGIPSGQKMIFRGWPESHFLFTAPTRCSIVLSSQQAKSSLLSQLYENPDYDAIVKTRKKGFQETAKCGKSLEIPYFKPISVLFYLFRDKKTYHLHMGRDNGLNVHSTREQIIPLCMREHIRSMHHPPSGHWIRLLFILWTIAE